MKEKPILFSGPMVRAILDGRKTMTRRICVPRYDDRKPCEHFEPSHDAAGWVMQRHCEHGSEGRGCPHGVVGDRLWVRETWAVDSYFDRLSPAMVKTFRWEGNQGVEDLLKQYRATDDIDNVRWRPSIFMPRWASRITLEITGVRVERLQDISEADAIAEGTGSALPYYDGEHTTGNIFVNAFAALWNSINGDRKDKHGNRLPYGWSDNPWVWIVEFRRAA